MKLYILYNFSPFKFKGIEKMGVWLWKLLKYLCVKKILKEGWKYVQFLQVQRYIETRWTYLCLQKIWTEIFLDFSSPSGWKVYGWFMRRLTGFDKIRDGWNLIHHSDHMTWPPCSRPSITARASWNISGCNEDNWNSGDLDELFLRRNSTVSTFFLNSKCGPFLWIQGGIFWDSCVNSLNVKTMNKRVEVWANSMKNSLQSYNFQNFMF